MRYAFRTVGGTIGITVPSILFQEVLVSQPLGQRRLHSIEEMLRDCYGPAQGQSRCPHDVRNAFTHALRALFLLSLAFAVTGLSSSVFVKDYWLHSELDRKPKDNDDV